MCICICMFSIYNMLIICFIHFSFRFFPSLISFSFHLKHFYNTNIIFFVSLQNLKQQISVICIINTCNITIYLNLLFPIHFVFDYCFQYIY